MKKRDKEEKIRVPFHPIVIVLFSLLFTFLVGGIVAGLNWTRLSKSKWKYPTIGLTAIGFVLYLIIYSWIPPSFGKFIIYISYAVFIGVGVVLYFIQKPYYDLWKLGKL